MANRNQKVHWEAAKYDSAMHFVSSYGVNVLEALRPQAGEAIVDFGCGTGDLAAKIAAYGAHVVGVDISPEMVERARTKYPELSFEVADGMDWRPTRLYDAVFSNAALHWMRDAEAAVRTMAGSLRVGGRLIAEFGGYGNVSHIVDALRKTLQEDGRMDAFVMPWYFPKVGEYASLLEANGMEVRLAMLYDRPTPLEEGEQGMMGWLRMFGEAMVPKATEEEKYRWFAAACGRLKSTPLYSDGRWFADYRRIRVEEVKLSESTSRMQVPLKSALTASGFFGENGKNPTKKGCTSK